METLQSWSEMNTQEYKKFKGLHKASLKDNMSNLELVLNMLAEASTTEISKDKQLKNLNENKVVAREGGSVARSAKTQLEQKLNKNILNNKKTL